MLSAYNGWDILIEDHLKEEEIAYMAISSNPSVWLETEDGLPINKILVLYQSPLYQVLLPDYPKGFRIKEQLENIVAEISYLEISSLMSSKDKLDEIKASLKDGVVIFADPYFKDHLDKIFSLNYEKDKIEIYKILAHFYLKWS